MATAINQSTHGQLEDQIAAAILDGSSPAGEAMPSVSELAIQSKVNPKAVERAYAGLVGMGVLAERGGSLVVTEQADGILRSRECERFLADELPALRRRLRALGIDPAALDWEGDD